MSESVEKVEVHYKEHRPEFRRLADSHPEVELEIIYIEEQGTQASTSTPTSTSTQATAALPKKKSKKGSPTIVQ